MAKGENIFRRRDGRWEARYIIQSYTGIVNKMVWRKNG